MRTPEPCLCGDPACRRCFPGGYDPPQPILDALETVLDLAVHRHHDRQSDETLTECHLCGQWEEHAGDCPIPAIERYMNG